MRRRGSHIFSTVGSQLGMRLSALTADHTLPRGTIMVLISVWSVYVCMCVYVCVYAYVCMIVCMYVRGESQIEVK
jgi:hypothetical protein